MHLFRDSNCGYDFGFLTSPGWCTFAYKFYSVMGLCESNRLFYVYWNCKTFRNRFYPSFCLDYIFLHDSEVCCCACNWNLALGGYIWKLCDTVTKSLLVSDVVLDILAFFIECIFYFRNGTKNFNSFSRWFAQTVPYDCFYIVRKSIATCKTSHKLSLS